MIDIYHRSDIINDKALPSLIIIYGENGKPIYQKMNIKLYVLLYFFIIEKKVEECKTFVIRE